MILLHWHLPRACRRRWAGPCWSISTWGRLRYLHLHLHLHLRLHLHLQVPEELLHSFLTTATDLQLEGLVGGAGEDKVKEKENEVEEKQSKEVKEKEDVAKEKEEDTEYEVIKVKNSDEVIAREFAEIKGHSCNICGKVLIHRSSLKRHMDKLHKKTEETVPITPLRSRGRSGVRREVVTKHLQGIVEAGEDEVVTVREEGVETRAGVEEEVVEEEVEKARPRSKSTPGEPGTLSEGLSDVES